MMSDGQQPINRIPEQQSLIGRLIGFCLDNRPVVLMLLIGMIVAGLMTAPFDWAAFGIKRYPVAVDAIPDIGENQQIVFTAWPGHSPRDVEDQIGYPLTVQLLGIPGVKTIRSFSMFGFSSVYVIFDEDVEFYWSRSRILEKLNSLSTGTLPDGVKPALGPDATALGQVFWYTLEGRGPDGRTTGGWNLQELRTVQDWYVKYWLMAANGVAEVGSVGGYVNEFLVEVDPDLMRAYGVTLEQVHKAVKASNMDVGARTLEINSVEYFIRGVGFVKSIRDIEESVVKVGKDNVPVLLKQVARVSTAPAARRGILDKGGAEVVGGVVVARYGDNPLRVINNVKAKIAETADALPEKVVVDYTQTDAEALTAFAEAHGIEAFRNGIFNQNDWLPLLRSLTQTEWPDGVTLSKLKIVPFYDRTGLIYETLGTLNRAILQQILITVIVVLIMVMNLRSSILISGMLPLAVLLCFAAMKLFGVQANIVALSGIAIAIGTIVDMGIVVSENILRHLALAPPDEPRREVIHRAASEVSSAVLTAVLTTVVSFLPVFTMIGAEGKLFKPLAFTKTFALISSIIITLTILPPMAYAFFRERPARSTMKHWLAILIILTGIVAMFIVSVPLGLLLALLGIWFTIKDRLPARWHGHRDLLINIIIAGVVGIILTNYWEPLGPERGFTRNLLFVGLLIVLLLGFFRLFQQFYPRMLRWCLNHKTAFMVFPLMVVLLGTMSWLGTARTFGWLPRAVRHTRPFQAMVHLFPGLGKEFMPPLDEGSFLYMPTTMTHASIGEVKDVLAKQDQAFQAIPEIESAVGKLGRAETPLDPAPISMIETIINYKSEYKTDADGKRIRYRYDSSTDSFTRDAEGRLIPDPSGRPYRQWREHIHTPEDIWQEIVKAAKLPGTTSAPRLQPIAARIVMLQSGMRAPMGLKIKGPSLDVIEKTGIRIEELLKQVPGVEPATVIADRIVGKPYFEIIPDRQALARYGIPVERFQQVLQTAIGGTKATTAFEGRERYAITIRYPRERRDGPEAMERILVTAANGTQVPLAEVADIQYVRGPQMIKSEDTFLVGYVVFDKSPQYAEVDVIEKCRAFLREKIDDGTLVLPRGVSYEFAGSYQNQIRAAQTLAVVLPAALFIIFMIIYLQFRKISTTLLVFSGIFVAWSGGFLLLWFYGQPWFLNFSIFGVSMRALFQIDTVNMSVAVWVGFLALFGIATDNGVIQATYLNQVFRERSIRNRNDLYEATILAAKRRVRPCLMTSATTILALIPVLTSAGRGSDVMIPMAIPSFGGMLVVLISIFLVPVLYATLKQRALLKQMPQH